MGKIVQHNYVLFVFRFGHKCTYAHDNDIKSQLQAKEDTNETSPILSNSGSQSAPRAAEPASSYDTSAVITGQSTQGNAKKKRPGLSNGIVPSKKAMKFFDKVYDK